VESPVHTWINLGTRASPDAAASRIDGAELPASGGFGWASLRRPRLAIFLSAPLSSRAEGKDRWLVQLRWLALGGMSATVITARLLVPGLRVLPLLGVLGAVGLANLGWTRALGRPHERDLLAPQIALDVALVTALLWFSGGLSNPFAIFLTFHIALAGALCDGRVTARVALAAVAGAVLLAWAPRLPLEGAPLGAAPVEVLGRLVSIVSLGLFLGGFALVHARRLAELRAQSERNERLAMVGRLASGLSHELATPLGTVLLGSRDLAELTRDSDGEIAGLAAAIAGEAERAGEIIHLLRGQVRPDSVEVVDLARVVPDLARRELDRVGFTGARVVTATAPVRAPVLRVALGQILRNLLANAAHAVAERHGPGEGRIEIAVIAHGARAEVSVTDDGPGFAAEIAGRLGEPFTTTKDVGEGLGLGLHVSATLARQMSAALRAEDAEGGGARVTLSLDLAPTREELP
jgi:two-component system sensor histidine kinase RegB